jgi:hypothetical protein
MLYLLPPSTFLLLIGFEFSPKKNTDKRFWFGVFEDSTWGGGKAFGHKN